MAILFDEQNKIFYLEGKSTTYAFMINKFGYAEHLYYGKRIGCDDITYIQAAGEGSMVALIPGIETERGNKYNKRV